MKPSRSFRGWLADAVNPYVVVLVSLIAVAALPVSRGWAAAVWSGLMIAATIVLRHGSRDRASELSRAILVSARTEGRRLNDRAPNDHAAQPRP